MGMIGLYFFFRFHLSKIYFQNHRTQSTYCRSLWDPKVCSSSIDYKEARNHNIKELLPYNKWHSSHDFSLLPSPFTTYICDLSCLLFKSFEIWLRHVRVEHSQFVRNLLVPMLLQVRLRGHRLFKVAMKRNILLNDAFAWKIVGYGSSTKMVF